MTIEDAAALGVLLTDLKTGDLDEIRERLAKVEKLRVPRFSAVQLMSLGRVGDPPEKIPGLLNTCRRFFPDDQTPGKRSRSGMFNVSRN
jgi:2-polyprenyl-6-methoxyphenol hydroxylase-like FAD-dependent oxidoreductase